MKMDFGTLSNDMVRLRDDPANFSNIDIADVNWKNENGKTLFMFALANCTPPPDMEIRYGVYMVRNIMFIIEHKDFDPNIQDNVGRTALMYFADRYLSSTGGGHNDFVIGMSSDSGYHMILTKMIANPKYDHCLKCNDGKFTYQYNNVDALFRAYIEAKLKSLEDAKMLRKDVAELKMMVRQLWMAPGMPGAVMGTEWKAIRKNSF